MSKLYLTFPKSETLSHQTDLTVEQIAAQMNYDNVSYLCRFFRNATGQSMMEFRRKQR